MRTYWVVFLLLAGGCSSSPPKLSDAATSFDITKTKDLGFFRLPLVRQGEAEKLSFIELDGPDAVATVVQKFNMPVGNRDITYKIQGSKMESKLCQGDPASVVYALDYGHGKAFQVIADTKFILPSGTKATLVATLYNVGGCSHVEHTFLVMTY